MATFTFHSARAAAEAALQGWIQVAWVARRGKTMASVRMSPPESCGLKGRALRKHAHDTIIAKAMIVRSDPDDGYIARFNPRFLGYGPEREWSEAATSAWQQIIVAIGPRPGAAI